MYRKTVLRNGVRLISERLEHFQSVSLGIWVDVGSRDESEKENGVSHFIEHMIFKKTRNRSNLQIAKELDAIGGLSNAFTGKEQTCFHAKVLAKHFKTLADILSDIFLNSIFDPEDMDKERQVILQEINMVEDTPDDQIHVLFNRMYWTNHPLGMPILGTGETISCIDRETIGGYVERFYTPDRIVVAAAGNVDHEEMVSYFQPLFETLKEASTRYSRTVPVLHSGVACHHKELEQVHMCLGGEGPNLSSQLRFPGAILNTILGGSMSSRLFQEIRERQGLAYSVYSFLSAYVDTGVLGVYVGTGTSELNRVLEIIHREIKRIQQGGISQSDLDDAREHLLGSILLGSESTDTRMMRLAKNEYVFGKYLSYEDLASDLDRVTVDDIITVARETFKDHQVTLVTLGPPEIGDLDLSSISFP